MFSKKIILKPLINQLRDFVIKEPCKSSKLKRCEMNSGWYLSLYTYEYNYILP